MESRVLKIALTADSELPVPPLLYGGIERIIDLLARQLVASGNEVTLFAHHGSRFANQLVPSPKTNSLSKADALRNALTLAHHVGRRGFDVAHSFFRIAYIKHILRSPCPR
jgi:hypothetical protein